MLRFVTWPPTKSLLLPHLLLITCLLTTSPNLLHHPCTFPTAFSPSLYPSCCPEPGQCLWVLAPLWTPAKNCFFLFMCSSFPSASFVLAVGPVCLPLPHSTIMVFLAYHRVLSSPLMAFNYSTVCAYIVYFSRSLSHPLTLAVSTFLFVILWRPASPCVIYPW